MVIRYYLFIFLSQPLTSANLNLKFPVSLNVSEMQRLPFHANYIKGKVFIISKLAHKLVFPVILINKTKKYYSSGQNVRNTGKSNHSSGRQ